MMNFEDKTKGWNVIFKGLISPFANRFKKYVQMEINSNLNDQDSDSDLSDEELMEIKKYKNSTRNSMARKNLQRHLTLLKTNTQAGNFENIEGLNIDTMFDKIERYILSINKNFKDKNPVAKGMLKRARRHSIHLDEFLTSNPEPKNTRLNKINNFLKKQNIIMNRMNVYRAQNYCNKEDITALENRRRKSWSKGNEGQEYLVLNLRSLIHESDARIFKNITKQEKLDSKLNQKMRFENSPLF